jgi:N-acetylglucosaminyldiphosphoundecaprenol N-acetyl-beta-D-mannosaminyltransferase
MRFLMIRKVANATMHKVGTKEAPLLEWEDILGYRITTLGIGQCVDRAAGWVARGERGRYFVCANPHSLETARRDAVFSAAIGAADLVVPDGIGMVLASRLLGGSIRERVTGSDMFLGLCQRLRGDPGRRAFFLGSTQETLRIIEEKMARDFPWVTVAGTYSPPFADELDEGENRRIIEAVNSARTDVLWVGMTAPKQEKWVFRNRERLDVACVGPVGAVFDFYSGRVKRSHPFFQRIGLEWFPRLIREPGRLWRRNLVSNPRFLLRVLRERSLR